MKIETVRSFQKNHKIPKKIWDKIFEEIRFTPSSFDLQPWRFFIIESQEKKNKLKKILIGNKKQLETSSAIILLCCYLKKIELSKYIYQKKFLNNQINQKEKEMILENIKNHYNKINEKRLQNETSFEGGLISLHFALVAQKLKYNICFMGGCDFEKIYKYLSISKDYLPLILIAIGKKEQNIDKKLKKNHKEKSIFKLKQKDFVNFI
ncbi:nitroreductase [Texas Phoenix palm phytoplasma]|uniref:Nitroreductase n=1 Tax=Texas Phoenix palm phytoplasma TaxID=176709 RepID=A0ABS5BIH1_9MOLU|nr:nitroreductase family protein [Texas Phoenix palm phytoplasma]MBP3059383.1 nitroreductase [Texas Phoenix palm phytoplasma]